MENRFLHEKTVLTRLLKDVLPENESPDYHARLAERLLFSFGSFAKILSTDAKDLIDEGGLTEAPAKFISALPEIFRYIIENGLEPGIKLKSPRAVADVLSKLFQINETERLYLFFLGERCKLNKHMSYTTYKRDRVEIEYEILNKDISESGAKYVIAAHNHPSGSCTPSLEDNEFALKLRRTCGKSGIIFLDFIIYTYAGCYSMNYGKAVSADSEDYTLASGT